MQKDFLAQSWLEAGSMQSMLPKTNDPHDQN